jgi:cytochrome c-type biogenesis protein CcmH/NrfF
LCALAATGAETPNDRVERLQNALLAPCCFAEPVARHQSEAAVKMRLEIARLAAEGKSDDEIVGRYVREFGDRILANPRSRPGGWSLAAPWALTALGAAGVSALIWKWRRQAMAAPAAGSPIDIPDSDWSDE